MIEYLIVLKNNIEEKDFKEYDNKLLSLYLSTVKFNKLHKEVFAK